MTTVIATAATANDNYSNVHVSVKPARANLVVFLSFWWISNIHIHSCQISLALLSVPPTACRPVTLSQLSVCGIVTSMSCPTSPLSLRAAAAAACPPACLARSSYRSVWRSPGAAGFNFLCFWEVSNPLNQIRKVNTAQHITDGSRFMFQDGMGKLHLNQDGMRLEGISEFLLPLYVNEIQSRGVSFPLCPSHKLSFCLLISIL